MSNRAAEGRNPVAALSAFLRLGFDELLTVLVISVLTSLAAIPIVTFGGAVVAGVDTITAVLGAGGASAAPRSLRGRVRYFAGSFADHLLQGVLFGPLVVAASILTATLVSNVFAPGSTAILVGAVLGLYLTILVLVWVYRAASVSLRAREAPGPIGCLGEALSDLVEDISWTFLQAVYAVTLWLVLVWTRVGIFLLLPGLLVVLEVVVYEERHGAGAESLVR